MVGYEMRASLILSIIQQLVGDQAPIVRKAAAHNLAVLLPRFSNVDIYSKVSPAKATTNGSCILKSSVPDARSKHFSFSTVVMGAEPVASGDFPAVTYSYCQEPPLPRPSLTYISVVYGDHKGTDVDWMTLLLLSDFLLFICAMRSL